MKSSVKIAISFDKYEFDVMGTKVALSPFRTFSYDDNATDIRLLRMIGSKLMTSKNVALMADARFASYFLKHVPNAENKIRVVIDHFNDPKTLLPDVPRTSADALPDDIDTVFLAMTGAFDLMMGHNRYQDRYTVVSPQALSSLPPEQLPKNSWVPLPKCAYPLPVSPLEIEDGLDMLLMDCPARNLSLMPNGLGYVHNALKKTGIRYQTLDLDIYTYHHFHVSRIFDYGGNIVLPSSKELPQDPWQTEHYELWQNDEVVEYFRPQITETVAKIVAAQPKILGLSIHACNIEFSRKLVNIVKARMPDIIIVVGGFSFYNKETGAHVFPEADYMCIGEADLSIASLVKALAAGERPGNMPGVVSRYTAPEERFIPAPMAHDLDRIEMPKYEWTDIRNYTNFDGYTLTPVIASRGCKWSRCTFCAERFYWRIHTAERFVDELEWHYQNGSWFFMFNESDLNGMPERLVEICEEVIRRKLPVKFSGQLRIHKDNSKEFFQTLRRAGFTHLRFGVDAFSANALRLQKKGYTKDMVRQNLRDCHEAGIMTDVNWVVGVPGETEEDMEEAIDFLLENQPYINKVANIHPLGLTNGSVYWLDPEVHKIGFRGEFEDLKRRYVTHIPDFLWYSEEPFIDAGVRGEWIEKAVLRMDEAGFPMGEWAKLITSKARSGGVHNHLRNLQTDKFVEVSTYRNFKIWQKGKVFIGVPEESENFDLNKLGTALPREMVRSASESGVKHDIDAALMWQDFADGKATVTDLGHQDLCMRSGTNMMDAPLVDSLAADDSSLIKVDNHVVAIENDALVKAIGEFRLHCTENQINVQANAQARISHMNHLYQTTAMITHTDHHVVMVIGIEFWAFPIGCKQNPLKVDKRKIRGAMVSDSLHDLMEMVFAKEDKASAVQA